PRQSGQCTSGGTAQPYDAMQQHGDAFERDTLTLLCLNHPTAEASEHRPLTTARQDILGDGLLWAHLIAEAHQWCGAEGKNTLTADQRCGHDRPAKGEIEGECHRSLRLQPQGMAPCCLARRAFCRILWQREGAPAGVYYETKCATLDRLSSARLLSWPKADINCLGRIQSQDGWLARLQGEPHDRTLCDIFDMLTPISVFQRDAQHRLPVGDCPHRRDERAKLQEDGIALRHLRRRRAIQSSDAAEHVRDMS